MRTISRNWKLHESGRFVLRVCSFAKLFVTRCFEWIWHEANFLANETQVGKTTVFFAFKLLFRFGRYSTYMWMFEQSSKTSTVQPRSLFTINWKCALLKKCWNQCFPDILETKKISQNVCGIKNPWKAKFGERLIFDSSERVKKTTNQNLYLIAV